MAERHLFIARHPETTANVEGRWVGRGNAPFTELGMRQAQAIAEEIVAFDPDVIASSPLERAWVPADRAARQLGVEHLVDERLSELDFGLAEGLTFDEARSRKIAFEFAARDQPVAEGGESRMDILGRSAEFVDEALETHDRVAIVTHGGVFRSVLVHVLGLPYEAIWAFHIRNGAVSELTVLKDGPDGEKWARMEEFRQVRA